MWNGFFVQQYKIMDFRNGKIVQMILFLLTGINETQRVDEQAVTWQTLDKVYPNMDSYP